MREAALKVITRYDVLIEARLLFGKLPDELRRAVDAEKYEIYKRMKAIVSSKRGMASAGDVFSVEDRVYSVEFALGKVRQDSPYEEAVQELLILDVQQIPGLHGIR